MKKKIFFIMSTDDYSGAEAVNFEIIDNLKNKYDFYWVSKEGNINNFLKEKDIKWIKIKNLSAKEIKRIVKEYQPDLLHATDYKASCICALANIKTPILSHIHNNSPWIKHINKNSIIFLLCSKRFKKILTVSSSIQNEYIFSKFIKNKIECIGNPLSIKKIKNTIDKEDLKKNYDICCVARLSKPKDPYKFLEIIKEIKKEKNNLKVIWVGDGELYNEIMNKTKELNLENNITFMGFQKNPYKFMAHSKLFLLTSKWEGYGLVAFEALTLGLPCIVSNVGGLKDVVDESCGKLCNYNKDYIEELLKLLNNEEYYKAKSKKAIEQSIKLENLKEYIKNLNYLYLKCIYGVKNDDSV